MEDNCQIFFLILLNIFDGEKRRAMGHHGRPLRASAPLGNRDVMNTLKLEVFENA